MWLRNSLLVHYPSPDHMYLVHTLDYVDEEDCELFNDITDDRLTWIPIQYGEREDDLSVSTIGIFKDETNDLDDMLYIMHITVGSYVIHLVGKKSAGDFDRFAKTLIDEMGVPVHVGFIHIPADGERDIYPPNWVRP